MKNNPNDTPATPTQFEHEMTATKTIYDALLSVPEERRAPIFKAVAILLGIIRE